MHNPSVELFGRLESGVRSYCRDFPTVFTRARDAVLTDVSGKTYIDFLSSAGAVNYGHNNPVLTEALVRYVREDGITTSLDLHTAAKHAFIEAFHELILVPRGLEYRLQFTGPTGTSVIESAVKLARKCTGRSAVVAFTNAFHGMSATSLSLTGSRHSRQNFMQGHVCRMPYEGYLGDSIDTTEYLQKLLNDESSGLDLPAAIILETIQVEGGLNIASSAWLQRLASMAQNFEIPIIVDDIQVGCGRAGTFFSFERAGIVPDMVCLSKSIGGIGLPMALLLIAPAMDRWQPGEDNGTFRGNNLAFVCGEAALREYWSNSRLQDHISVLEKQVQQWCVSTRRGAPHQVHDTAGRGLVHGLKFERAAQAQAVQARCFASGLIVERCGPDQQVLKIMPPLTISPDLLSRGLGILAEAVGYLH